MPLSCHKVKGAFTINEDRHGLNKYRVEGRLGGKRIRAFFPTRELAEEHARLRNIEVRNAGLELATVSSELRAEAKACQQRLDPIGATLSQAVDFYLAHHDVRSKSVTLSVACAAFRRELTRRVENKEASEAHRENLDKSMRRLLELFGDVQIVDITTLKLREELTRMPVSPASKNHYKGHMGVVFSFAIDQGWLKENPCDPIKKFKDRSGKQPEIFTPLEAAKILEHARADMIPALAIGLFAGLRPTECQRLDWSEIRWDRKQLWVDSTKTKTAQPRWVAMSDNLIEWLTPYRQASGPVDPLGKWNRRRLNRDAVQKAGLKHWAKDGLRHSFGSYHMALYQNAALTADEMGHMSTKMIHEHYENPRVTREDALTYFAIRPLAPEKIVAMAV